MYFFDAHCDYLSAVLNGEQTALTLDSVQKAGLQKTVFAVFEGAVSDRSHVEAQAALFAQIRPPVAASLAFEGLGWVEGERDLAWICSQKPVYAGPMWNHANHFGGSCLKDAPLTLTGREQLRYLSDRKVHIDLAHAGETMFYSVCDSVDRVIVSHANVFEICPHPRNLKKAQIRLLIERKAFLGLTFYSPFVGASTVEKLFEHIDTVCDMGGEDILGFGSDLDGCRDLIEKAQDASVFTLIAEEMEKRHFGKRLIEKISHGNFERIINTDPD